MFKIIKCQGKSRCVDTNWNSMSWCLAFIIQECIFRLTCSHRELIKDHVLTSACVKIFRTVTRNAVNKRVWRKKDCSWLPLNKHAMNISIQTSTNVSLSTVLQEPEHGFLRIRAHLSWRTGKHLHVLHVLRTYFTCSHPGWYDGTNYATLIAA